MTELNKEQRAARPISGWAFLSIRTRISFPCLKAHLIFWPLVIGGLLLDLWSKKAVFEWLQQQGRSSFSIIDGFFQLVIAENAGAAFGIASGQRYFLVAISAVALVVIFAVFLFSGYEQKLVHIALGFFTGGVCGNLYDRIFNHGFVRDFIDVVYWPGKHWPAFNVADTMLCIAVGLMVISSLFTEQSCRKHVQQHK